MSSLKDFTCRQSKQDWGQKSGNWDVFIVADPGMCNFLWFVWPCVRIMRPLESCRPVHFPCPPRLGTADNCTNCCIHFCMLWSLRIKVLQLGCPTCKPLSCHQARTLCVDLNNEHRSWAQRHPTCNDESQDFLYCRFGMIVAITFRLIER